MSVEDKTIAMHARHSIAKTPIDISQLVISCCRGVVELNGKVKKPRNFAGDLNLHAEFRILCENVRSANGVKDVIFHHVEIIE